MKPKILVVLLLIISSYAQAQLNITVKTAAQAPSVVDTFLSTSGLSGPPTNIQYRGGPQGMGVFQGTSNLGIGKGIILSSGATPNIAAAAGTQNDVDHAVEGDADLQTLSSQPIRDVAVLEFDFIPKTDTIRFRYSFGSEEYPEYVCNVFNDVFGFFVTGPKPGGGNYTNQNIAIIPGTTLPVGVNTVNPGVPGASSGGGQCNLANQSLAYSTYYINNVGTTVIFDGLTVVLEAVIPVVQCGSYHIKLAVGDASDGVFDSGVFLEAHSFGGGFIHLYDTTTSIGQDSSVLCVGDTIQLTAPTSTSYNWGVFGSTQTINVTQPGNYQCIVFNPLNGCINASYTYHILGSNATAVIDTLGPVTLCAGDSVQLFSAITGSAYLWSNGATTSSIWVDYSEVGSYTLTVTDQWGICTAVSTPVTIFSGSAAAQIAVTGNTSFCAGGSVTLTANPGTSYVWSNGATTQAINVTTSGNYVVTVNNSGCAASSAPTVVTVSNPSVSITPSGSTTFCQPSNVVLNATAGFNSYAWSSGATTASLTAATTGTYTVTATDVVGCTATATISVTANTGSASIAALTDSVLCNGDSILLTANAGTNYNWNNGATSQSIWASAAGLYNVQVTNANGCTATSLPTQVYSSAATAVITSPASDTIICIGSNLNLTASGGGNYLWSNGSTASSLSLSPSLSGTYTVTVTNADGCVDVTDVLVTVNDPQVSITSADPLSFCSGSSANISATGGFSNYSWSTGQTGINTINITSTTSVSVLATDADGCTATSNVLQTQVSSATVNVTLSSDPVLCPGETISLQSTPAVNYTWSNGATSASITTGPGTYTVSITDANGCTAVSNSIVLTQSIPGASITSASGLLSFCPDSSLELIANNGASYLWSTGAVTQSIVIVDAATYEVTVTNADNCTAQASITVNESVPVASITPSGPTTFCAGSQVTLSANNGTGYLWSDGSTSQSITVNAANNYSVTVFDAIGCPASDAMSVIVNSATASISPSLDTTFCTGDSIQLFNQSPNTVSVQWSNGLTGNSIWVNTNSSYSFVVTDINGCTAASTPVNTFLNIPIAFITPQSNTVICPNTSVILNANNSTGNTFVWSDGSTASSLSASANGSYVVTVTNSLGCVATSAPVDVLVSIPTASITVNSNTDLCPGQQASMTANIGASYLWSPGGQTTQNLLTSAGGSYTVEVTDSIGCVATSTPVQVNNLPAEAVTAVTGTTSFCRGETVTISVLTPGNYVWSNGETGNSITVGDGGLYTVAVTNLNGCIKVSDPVAVTVHEYPVISFTADSSSECEAFKIRFRNYSTFDNNSLIHWSFGDGTTTNQYSPVHWYTIDGNYNVVLTITSPFGCSSSDSSEIPVIRYPDPVADFSIVNNIDNVFAGPISFVNKSKNAVRYLWDFGDKSGSTDVNPIHDYREPGYYTIKLTAFNVANCENSEEKEVTISPLFIPSAFTPNGDGKNDFFPTGLPSDLDVSAFQVSIFNRWGERIFFSDNPSYGWNGNGKDGSPAPNGGYVYEMKVSDRLNKDFTFRGNLTLVR